MRRYSLIQFDKPYGSMLSFASEEVRQSGLILPRNFASIAFMKVIDKTIFLMKSSTPAKKR